MGSSAACSLQAQRLSPVSHRESNVESGEKRSSLKLSQNLPLEGLPSCKITLVLGSSRISKMSLSNGPTLIGCQKPKTKNQTNDSLSWIFVWKSIWTKKKYCVTHMFAMQLWRTNMRDGQVGKMEKWSGERAVERRRTGDSVVVIVVRQGCSRWGSVCHCHDCHRGSAEWCAAAWSWHPNTAPEHTA